MRIHETLKVEKLNVEKPSRFLRPLQKPRLVPEHLPEGSEMAKADQERPGTSSQNTVHCQTEYRESETQTDPYTPKYVPRPGTPPEVLSLASLKTGRGLPAGLKEVQNLEFARRRRDLEARLPPLDDITQRAKRVRMMMEIERERWSHRERAIQKLQEKRLALLTQVITQREERQQQLLVKHLDSHFARRQHQKEAKIKRIRQDYVLSIRRLMEKRRNVEGKLRRSGVVERYCSRGSRVHYPGSAMGRLPHGDSDRDSVTSWLQNTYEGLLLLESTLPPSVTEPCIRAPKPRSGKGFVKRADRREMELIRTHEELKERKTKVEEKKPLRFLYKIEKPAPRPPTPAITPPPAGLEERDLAVICLQKLLRGAASKETMSEEKERRMDLIQELRSTHALQQEEQELQQAEKQNILALQRQRELHRDKALAAGALQAGVAGGVMADMLDFLSKELQRLQEERRIHAFTLLAERHRRMREAEESGRRQAEERRRREEDEIFRQVVLVHQATVDLYLEDVILSSIEKTADEQAREEIHKMAEEINDIAYAMEESLTNVRSEEIVAELVYSFLIPEVQKTTVRNRVKATQQQHIQAARHVVHGAVEEATAATAPPPTEPAMTPQPPTAPPAMEEATAPPTGSSEAHTPPQCSPTPPVHGTLSQGQGEGDGVGEGGDSASAPELADTEEEWSEGGVREE
ncbi:cilia- and flagella-associated protein 91-like [Conger conger]|uniref:cilia- and flagella-associated protein 91-like n=1 Tax=Conger conger TaxID=82655 RepID=UPI002A598BB7|nr:cilia- and flagella-associated protein 91-like [Conger conger]